MEKLLKGCFPIGLPVLIHDQLADNELQTHIALVTQCLDLPGCPRSTTAKFRQFA